MHLTSPDLPRNRLCAPLPLSLLTKMALFSNGLHFTFPDCKPSHQPIDWTTQNVDVTTAQEKSALFYPRRGGWWRLFNAPWGIGGWKQHAGMVTPHASRPSRQTTHLRSWWPCSCPVITTHPPQRVCVRIYVCVCVCTDWEGEMWWVQPHIETQLLKRKSKQDIWNYVSTI